jgi:hypothetical protein
VAKCTKLGTDRSFYSLCMLCSVCGNVATLAALNRAVVLLDNETRPLGPTGSVEAKVLYV